MIKAKEQPLSLEVKTEGRRIDKRYRYSSGGNALTQLGICYYICTVVPGSAVANTARCWRMTDEYETTLGVRSCECTFDQSAVRLRLALRLADEVR